MKRSLAGFLTMMILVVAIVMGLQHLLVQQAEPEKDLDRIPVENLRANEPLEENQSILELDSRLGLIQVGREELFEAARALEMLEEHAPAPLPRATLLRRYTGTRNSVSVTVAVLEYEEVFEAQKALMDLGKRFPNAVGSASDSHELERFEARSVPPWILWLKVSGEQTVSREILKSVLPRLGGEEFLFHQSEVMTNVTTARLVLDQFEGDALKVSLINGRSYYVLDSRSYQRLFGLQPLRPFAFGGKTVQRVFSRNSSGVLYLKTWPTYALVADFYPVNPGFRERMEIMATLGSDE